METNVREYQPQDIHFTITDAITYGSLRLEHAYSIDTLSPHAQNLVGKVSAEREKQDLVDLSGNTQEPWYYLSGTGFFVHGQVELLLKDLQQEIRSGREFQNAVDFCLVKVKEDIKGFVKEYLEQLAGLKWNIGWTQVNEVKKLYGIDYNGALLDDLTGAAEREGALRDAWFEDKDSQKNKDRKNPAIETWLRTAPVGSKVLLVSPSGWSGFDNFVYPQTQIYYVEVGEGESVKSFTLRYDVPIDKNEAFQKALGISVADTWDERRRIKQMLASPIFIGSDGIPLTGQSDKRIDSPLDVIKLMQDIKGSNIAFSDPKFGDRTFDSMRAFIQDPEKFSTYSPQVQVLIDTFCEFASWELSQGKDGEDIRQNLEIALAMAIVELKELYFPSTKQSADVVDLSGKPIFNDNRDYQQQLSEIRELPGCAGTTGKSSVRTNSLGVSQGLQLSEQGGICEKITCRQCGWQPKDEETVGDCCPTCGWAPGKPVDKDWDKKNKGKEETTEKPAQVKPKKKEAVASTKAVEQKQEPKLVTQELPIRRGENVAAKAA